MFDADLLARAERLLANCRTKTVLLATAESCTGGLISGLLTEIAGSSDVFERGFVTYSNQAKSDLLGVAAGVIAEHGAVSEQVARTMAEGALANSRAHITVAVTGVAGPGGGSAEKPVGLVHMASARKGSPTVHTEHRFGDIGRSAVRQTTVVEAIALLETQVAAA